MELLIILTIIVIIGSAICSSTEAALFSSSLARVQTELSKGTKGSKDLAILKEQLPSAISAIVILNNVINIVGSIILGGIASTILSPIEVGIYTLIITIAIIVFGEIVPKNLGERYAMPIGLTISPILRFIILLLQPLIIIVNSITHILIGVQQGDRISEDEIKMMAVMGHEENSIEKDESFLIQNVFKMNDLQATDVMTPRVNLWGLHKDTSLNDQKKDIYDSQHSRLVVYGEDYDEVLGYVLLRDLLEALARNEGDKTPTDFLHTTIKVKKETQVDSLLIIFQRKRQHMIVVDDGFGGVDGIVTLEDVLEVLVGEIVDETDEDVDMRDIQTLNPAHS